MVSIYHPYQPLRLIPKAAIGLSVPTPASADEMSRSLRYASAKRPTRTYVAKLSEDEQYNLQEFMENALLENVAALTVLDPRQRKALPEPMTHISTIEVDHPKLHKKVHRVQWTWVELKKCFGSVNFNILQEYWMVPEHNVQPMIRRISPRCALKATGMSLSAAQQFIQGLNLSAGTLTYSRLHPALQMQTNIGKAQSKLTPVVGAQPTPVPSGQRRKPIQEYALRLPHIGNNGEILPETYFKHSLLLGTMAMPSYGDDLCPQYISIAKEAAEWALKNLADQWQKLVLDDKGEEGTDPEVLMLRDRDIDAKEKIVRHLETIAGWTWDSDHPLFDEDTTENPASSENIAWEANTRLILASAMSLVMTSRWSEVINGLNTYTSLVQGTAWRLAAAMIRVMLRSRYRTTWYMMDAPTLLGISMVTGVSPIVFLNYFQDHTERTGLSLFTASDADLLRDMVSEQEVRGSGVMKLQREERKEHLVAEIHDWANTIQDVEDSLAWSAMSVVDGDLELNWTDLLAKEYWRAGGLSYVEDSE